MLYQLLMESNSDIKCSTIHANGRHYSYRELEKLSKGFCAFLDSYGITRGSKIVIVTEPNICTVAAILGCIYYGVVFVPIGNDSSLKEREHIIHEVGAKLVVENLTEKMLKMAGTISSREYLIGSDMVYVLYTSGSSGYPKGVVGCVSQIIFCIKKINERLMNTCEDRILCALPLSFDYGLYQIFLALSAGADLYLEDGKVLQTLISTLKKERITAFPVVPSMLHALCYSGLFRRTRLPYLRYICATGDRLNLHVVKRIHEQFPHAEIIPMYGLTECKRVSVMPFNHYHKTLEGSCGLPLDGVKVRLLDENEDGVGQLIVIGENVMTGYYGADEESVFFVDSDTSQKALHTGDLFRIDSEGFLYYCGRIKRIIKSKGFRISNAQIERYFYDLEAVREVRAEGIPDEMIGEKIGLAIYGEIDFLRKQFDTIYKSISTLYRPDIIYFSFEPLPKNANGKFDDKKICMQIMDKGKKWI